MLIFMNLRKSRSVLCLRLKQRLLHEGVKDRPLRWLPQQLLAYWFALSPWLWFAVLAKPVWSQEFCCFLEKSRWLPWLKITVYQIIHQRLWIDGSLSGRLKTLQLKLTRVLLPDLLRRQAVVSLLEVWFGKAPQVGFAILAVAAFYSPIQKHMLLALQELKN